MATQEKTKFRLKIFHRVLFGYLIIPLIALIAFLGLIHNAKNNQTIVLEKNLATNATLAANQVNDWVDKNIRLSNYIASLSDVTNMNASTQKPLLEAAKQSTSWMTLMFTIDSKGKAVARSDDKKLLDYSDREYFKKAMSSGGVIGDQVLIGKAYPEPLHCFAVPIKNNSRSVGTVTQCSQLSEVSKNVANIKIGDTGHAFLVDSKKRLIAHGSDTIDLKTKLADFSKTPALMENTLNEVFTFEENGVKKIAYIKEASLGWTLVLQQDYSEAFASVEKDTRYGYIFLSAMLFITIILSIVLSKGLSNPINAVSQSAIDISKGDFSKQIPGIERGDEIGQLARSINRTKRSLEISLNRLKKP